MKQLIKIFCLTLSLTLLVGCNDKVDAQVESDSPDKEVVETQKESPTDPKATEVWEPVPEEIQPYGQGGAPSDAIVLFDGSNLDAWESSKDGSAALWVINEDGSMTVKDKTGDIQTKQEFGSIQLHLEWRSNPDNKAEGQARSNSGVFLQNRYEVQILDNNDNPTYVNGQAGSIYKQSAPLVKASVPTGDWNSYDIIFHAPEFDSEGVKTKSGTITVLLNGVIIQDHFEIQGTSEYIGWPKNIAHGKAPLKLQDHADMSGVGYRNIWVRELN